MLVKMSICATCSLSRSYTTISGFQRHKRLIWHSAQSRNNTTYCRYTVILHRSVYFTTDRLQKPFTHDNPLRLHLKLTVPVFPVSLPYTRCLAMPISRHFRHFIRTTHAYSLRTLHMVLAEIFREKSRIMASVGIEPTITALWGQCLASWLTRTIFGIRGFAPHLHPHLCSASC